MSLWLFVRVGCVYSAIVIYSRVALFLWVDVHHGPSLPLRSRLMMSRRVMYLFVLPLDASRFRDLRL
jgi:hypothetical protein